MRRLLKAAAVFSALAGSGTLLADEPAEGTPAPIPASEEILLRLASGEALQDPAAPDAGRPVRPGERAGALRMLARSHHPKALGLLTAALKDPDRAIRLAAVRSLRELGDGAAVGALAEVLNQGSATRKGLPHSYRAVDYQDPELPLVERTGEAAASFEKEEDLAVKREAARALGELGETSAAPALLAAAGSAPPDVAEAAEAALETLANRSLVAKHPDRKARLEAWRAWLASVKGQTRTQWVLSGFQERFPQAALSDLESPQAISTVAQALFAQEPWIRANACDRFQRLANEVHEEQKLLATLDHLRSLITREGELGRDPPEGTTLKADIQRAARRAFGRAFFRLGSRYAEIKELPPEAYPFAGFTAGMAAQTPLPGLSNAYESLGALATWWDRVRDASRSRPE